MSQLMQNRVATAASLSPKEVATAFARQKRWRPNRARARTSERPARQRCANAIATWKGLISGNSTVPRSHGTVPAPESARGEETKKFAPLAISNLEHEHLRRCHRLRYRGSCLQARSIGYAGKGILRGTDSCTVPRRAMAPCWAISASRTRSCRQTSRPTSSRSRRRRSHAVRLDQRTALSLARPAPTASRPTGGAKSQAAHPVRAERRHAASVANNSRRPLHGTYPV